MFLNNSLVFNFWTFYLQVNLKQGKLILKNFRKTPSLRSEGKKSFNGNNFRKSIFRCYEKDIFFIKVNILKKKKMHLKLVY